MINSLDWRSHPWEAKGPGEVYGAKRNYNGKKKLPFPPSDHVCGSAEEFAQGEDLDHTRPATSYDQWGLPRCCAAPVVSEVCGCGEVFPQPHTGPTLIVSEPCGCGEFV